jgi:hypothetical protein
MSYYGILFCNVTLLAHQPYALFFFRLYAMSTGRETYGAARFIEEFPDN